jgi:hypothetical protein
VTTIDPTDAIADIRALADFLEEHPEVSPPAFSGSLHIRDPAKFAAAAAALGDEAVLEVRNGYVVVTLRFGLSARAAISVQTLMTELLGERQSPLDRTDEVRRALDDLATREGVSADE